MNPLHPVSPADLRALGPFRTLPEPQVALLAALARRRTLAADEVLFEEGAHSDALFVIERGRIRARRKLPTGEVRSIATLGRGDLLGEMGIMEGKPRSVQAVAAEAATLVELPAEALLQHMSGDPLGARDLMAIVVGAVSERLRRANGQLLTLFQVGRLLGQAIDLDLVVNPVLELLLEGLREAESATLWLVNGVSGELELQGLAHGRGRNDHMHGLESALSGGRPALPLGDSLLRLLERTEEGAELQGIPSGSMLSEWVSGGPRLLVAPLRPRATLDGALILMDWTPQGSFAPADADLIATIAAQLGGAIERLQHQQEQRDRMRLEREFF